jgi:hypothetical protein
MGHHPYAGANVLAYEGGVGVEGAFADGAQRALLFTLVSSSLHRIPRIKVVLYRWPSLPDGAVVEDRVVTFAGAGN